MIIFIFRMPEVSLKRIIVTECPATPILTALEVCGCLGNVVYCSQVPKQVFVRTDFLHLKQTKAIFIGLQ